MTMHTQHDDPLKWYAEGMEPARRDAVNKLSAASEYAWIQLANPAMRAEYESHTRTKKSAYALAVDDYLHAPQIRAVNLELYTGRAGESITMHVVDDFKVAGVRIALLDGAGTTLEAGEAREQGSNTWCYKTRHTVPPAQRLTLVITAFDIPGNTDEQTIHLLTASGSDTPCARTACRISNFEP